MKGIYRMSECFVKQIEYIECSGKHDRGASRMVRILPKMKGIYRMQEYIQNKKEYIDIYYKMNKHIISKKRSEVMKCVFCDRNYTKRHKARHQKSLYCLEKQKELKNNNVE